MNNQLLERTVAQLVRERPARSRVFQQHGIDFCCGGKRTLRDICSAHNLDPAVLAGELAKVDNAPPPSQTPELEQIPLSAIIADIVSAHHDHLRVELPRLQTMLDRVNRVHAERDPRLLEMLGIFTDFMQELYQHMMKEERVLFPAIQAMEHGSGVPRCFATIAHPIAQMEAEHDDADNALASLRRLSDDFTPPEGACNTWCALLDGLRELDENMRVHIHKENDILFPRAIAREHELPKGN